VSLFLCKSAAPIFPPVERPDVVLIPGARRVADVVVPDLREPVQVLAELVPLPLKQMVLAAAAHQLDRLALVPPVGGVVRARLNAIGSVGDLRRNLLLCFPYLHGRAVRRSPAETQRRGSGSGGAVRSCFFFTITATIERPERQISTVGYGQPRRIEGGEQTDNRLPPRSFHTYLHSDRNESPPSSRAALYQ